MAATVTYRGAPSMKSGLIISISETALTTETESSFVAPKKGIIKSFRAQLTGGASSNTIDPALGRATGFVDTINEILAKAVTGPSALINAGDLNIHYEAPGGQLFLLSQPDDTSNNTDATVSTEIKIVEAD